jgi:hypothetical protein
MLVPIALLAVAVVLWLGAATFVTYRILHPPFQGACERATRNRSEILLRCVLRESPHNR